MLKPITLFAVFFVFTTVAAQVYNPAKKYSSQQLLQDYDFLVTAFTLAHPGRYWHTPVTGLDKHTANTRKQIAQKDSLTEIEFLQLAAQLNSVVKCAHSSIEPSSDYENWWRNNALLIPFNIITFDGKYYVYQNYSDNAALAPGTQILSINGSPIENIIKTIFTYIPADGENISRKKHVLKTGFYWYYSAYINNTATSYTIKYRPLLGKKAKTIIVSGITKNTLDEKRVALNPLSTQKTTGFKLLPEKSTGILTLPTFRGDLMKQAGINFQQYLDSVFNILKTANTQNLIVDLRDNGGGLSEYGAVLLSHLADSPFVYCKNQWVTFNTFIDFINYEIPETFRGFPRGIVNEGGQNKWTKHTVLGTRQPATNSFKRRVFFIINGKGASTTAEVVSVAYTNNMGVFVGEEVGGAYKGNTGGILGNVTLPNTKLQATIGMVKYELPVNNNLPAVPVNYPVQPTLQQWLQNTDAEMEFVFGLIGSGK